MNEAAIKSNPVGSDVSFMRAWTWRLLAVVWILAVTAGFISLFIWTWSPGKKGSLARAWPRETRLVRHDGRPTLLAFLHSKCPCSDATVSEMELLMPRLAPVLPVRVVLMDQDGESRLLPRLRKIPGVEIRMDPSGREAELFGALTGGQVFLYGSSGELLFEGGITPGRGHEGESEGRFRLLAALEMSGAGGRALASAEVYGCPLRTGGEP
ncbi:MAG: hypothetical protein HUU37_09125 [Bdellovibrionales bacterium]|nr:hypothetical protein [Bdellovibrionales bacterium]